MKTYTIQFPYKHPDLTVRTSDQLARFRDVSDGALFMIVGDIVPTPRVFEKLGTCGDVACLLPWDAETTEMVGNPICVIMEEVE